MKKQTIIIPVWGFGGLRALHHGVSNHTSTPVSQPAENGQGSKFWPGSHVSSRLGLQLSLVAMVLVPYENGSAVSREMSYDAESPKL